MAFLGGPECSTAGNPLSQFTKHVQDDKSLQRDRLVGRGPGGLGESMRSRPNAAPQGFGMNEFAQSKFEAPTMSFDDAQQHQMQILTMQERMAMRQQQEGSPQPFAMDQMRRELEQASQRSASPSWAQEFGNSGSEGMDAAYGRSTNGGFSPADFAKFQQSRPNSASLAAQTQQHSNVSAYRPSMGTSYGGYGGMGMNMGLGMGMQRQFNPTFSQQQSIQSDKGKGRLVELNDTDWEAQFASLDSVDQDTLDREANAAMEAELNQMDRQMMDNPEFEEHMHMGDDMDQWQNFDSLNLPTAHHDPALGDYMFEQDNIFSENANPYDEGVQIMNEGGNLSLAALAFEAAVQKDPTHVAAWTKLGQAQAQNEKETPAIRALEQALKLDPSNLEALMGLAVSYTNEGYDSTAYRTLERWVATKYPSLVTDTLSSDENFGFTDRQALHEKVTDLFIRAAQLSPSGEHMDPDVQVGLGVLFYGAEEYEKAVDCFGTALASRETGATNADSEIHLLWNRLGATLANSGRSEEAIEAYGKALEIRQNFVRARYNLGVSCINLGAYEQAAQHLLGALDMHRVEEKMGRDRIRSVVGDDISERRLEEMVLANSSTNLYDTLRRIFAQMDRRDLQEKCGPGMDLEQFRGEFDF